ncbi:MAG: hypothetical protein CSB16_01575 [Clostridiales bacterium]|nr:MAG: hypothetical protein CSB16_01575 [Clostridiales bacterium]
MSSTDIFILVIIIFTMLIGYRKSLFRNVSEFFTLAISLWVAFNFFGKFAGSLNKISAFRSFFAFLNRIIFSKLTSFDEEINFTLKELENTGMTKEFNLFFKNGTFFKEKGSLVFTELSQALVLNVLSIVILFVLTMLVLKFVFSFFENTSRMPGAINIERVGGIVFSLLKGLLYGAIIALVVSNIAVFFKTGPMHDLFYNSKISLYLYNSGFVGFFFH